MQNWIYSDMLFCNDYNAVALCEYTRELSLLKELIKSAEEAVLCKENNSWNTYEGICYMFAKSIIEYAKMAYDNIILGHFSSSLMIVRAMIENNVCLDIIYNDEKEELWKYYFVQSYRNCIKLAKKGLSKEDKKNIQKMYCEYEINREFYRKREDGRSYINLPYGWTYTINTEFNFKGVCNLVNGRDYDDFCMMSDYSHGTSLFQKMCGGTWIEHIMNMISSILMGMERLVTVYCYDTVDVAFCAVYEDLEASIRGALGI